MKRRAFMKLIGCTALLRVTQQAKVPLEFGNTMGARPLQPTETEIVVKAMRQYADELHRQSSWNPPDLSDCSWAERGFICVAYNKVYKGKITFSPLSQHAIGLVTNVEGRPVYIRYQRDYSQNPPQEKSVVRNKLFGHLEDWC